MKVELNIISMNEAAALPVWINYSPKNQNHRKYKQHAYIFMFNIRNSQHCLKTNQRQHRCIENAKPIAKN